MDRRVADFYQRFADVEARGSSAIYEEWASGIAHDEPIVDRIATLPGIKAQPNLVFAAARLLGAPDGPYPPFRDWLLEHWNAVVPVVLGHRTQTNEAGRCAVILPVLSRIAGPVALIEVGASAGLCLYPDRYSYRYDTGDGIVALDPPGGPSSVILPCRIDAADVPSRLPDVVWRAGVDLDPIDAQDPAALAWLETLVWPEHDERRSRLRAAAALAADDPPLLVEGDLVEEVRGLIERAPRDATVVVFHSAVLVYLEPSRRAEFVDVLGELPDVEWISNEGARVLPAVEAQLPREAPGLSVLALNGEPVALVGPHGQSFEAL